MITKSVMQSGSFGILAAGPNAGADKLVNVWFCGAWKVRRNASGREAYGAPWMKQAIPEGHIGNTSMPCVHRTRAEAVECSRSAAIAAARHGQ